MAHQIDFATLLQNFRLLGLITIRQIIGDNMKVLWILIFALTSGVHLTEALGEEDENKKSRSYITYSLSDSEDTPRLIKELLPGEIILPGSYNMEANLSLKSKKVEVELETLTFEPIEDNRSSSKKLQQGWTSIDNTFSWNPENEENILTIPLQPKTKEQLPAIHSFDELQLDFKDLTSNNPSLLSLNLDIAWDEPEKIPTTALITGKQLVSINSLHLPSASWKEKDFSYLINRTLGLTHDSSWNFIRQKGHFFYQNRFHLNLNEIETIDIHFKPDVSLEKITSLSCNLRLRPDSLLALLEVMECERFPKNIFRSDGHLVLRIWINEILRSKYGNNNNGFLKEIIFRIAENQLKNIQEQPIDSIQFRSFFKPSFSNHSTASKDTKPPETKDRVFHHFQTPITTLYSSSNKKQLIFPLERLTDLIGKTGRIQNISLLSQPKRWDAPSKFLLQRFRMVSHGNEQLPKIFDTEKKLSTRWGGPFFDQDKNNKKIEWTEVRSFFSFTTPFTDQGRSSTTYLKGARPKTLNFKTTSNPIEFKGIQIQTQNKIESWHAEKDGLRLNGEGNWVELIWPVQTSFGRDSWFFMSFGEGKENILDLKIIPLTENGELPPITATPNKPERLKKIPEEVKNLKIKIMLFDSSFTLKLKEMVVFQPLQVKPPKTLDTPMLVEEETPLIPNNIQSRPQQQVTIFKQHLSAPFWPQKGGVPSEISWVTKVNKQLNWIKGIKFIYKVPSTMHVNNPCWLHFTLVSTNHKVNRVMCSEESTNEIIFPAEQLFHGINYQYDEKLKNISWKIKTANQPRVKDQPLPIDIAVSLIGYDNRTFRSVLLSLPIIEQDGNALFPISLDGLSTEDIYQHNLLANFGTVFIKDKTRTIPQFNFLDHPYFQTKNFFLRKKELILSDDWILLTKKEVEPASQIKEVEPTLRIVESQAPPFAKILYFFLLVAGLWWGLRQKEKLASLQWLTKLSPGLAKQQIKVLLSIAAGFYIIGSIFGLVKWHTSEDIFRTISCISIILAWRSFIWKIRPDLAATYPKIATAVYRERWGPYISGFILTLVVAAFFITIQLDHVAAQFAATGYYMLVAGVILKFKSLRTNNSAHNKKTDSKNSETGITLA